MGKKQTLSSIRRRRKKGGASQTMRKKVSKGQITKPPRIVILDNDETTGAYWSLFSIIHIFRDYEITNFHLQDIIPAITDFAVKTNVFRPGLVKLITTIYKLRQKGLLDAIAMYTYQTKFMGRKGDMSEFYNSHGQQVDMPHIIDYCFSYIATGSIQPFCNLILTRDEHMEAMGLKEGDKYGPKSVELVMKKLHIHPTNDLRGLIFIDDCYLNHPTQKKYMISPLTCMYIKDYRTIMSEVQPILDGLEQLYTNILHKYISKSIFDEFMDRMRKHRLDDSYYYSECSPKGVPFTYDKTDLTKLAGYIDKYYVAGKF